MKVGDLIYVYDSNTPTANMVVVLSNASGVVDVSDGQAIISRRRRLINRHEEALMGPLHLLKEYYGKWRYECNYL